MIKDLPTFREMPRRRVAAIGLTLTVALVLTGLFYNRIPALFSSSYQAHFADIGNLRAGDPVVVSGIDVGEVQSVELSGTKVLVRFTAKSPARLGSTTRAAIVTTSILGKRGLRLTPQGPGQLAKDTPIPLDRTVAAYSLANALDDTGRTLTDADPALVDKALRTVSNTLDEASPALAGALGGVARLSTTISDRNTALRELLERSRRVTGVLAQRSDQVNALIADANILLGQLSDRQAELTRLLVGARFLARQIVALIRENKAQLTPALTKIESVIEVLNSEKAAIEKAIPGLRNYSMSLGESISTGPFFTAYTANLVPVIFIQPLIEKLIAQTPDRGGR